MIASSVCFFSYDNASVTHCVLVQRLLVSWERFVTGVCGNEQECISLHYNKA